MFDLISLMPKIPAPALDLNFAGTKSLDPRITFTRSSNATYFDLNGVLQTASPNVARFDHNPVTRESLGLLIEEQRTNLVLWSEEFDNAVWEKQLGVNVTTNTVLSPLGTLSADTVTANANAFIYQNFTSSVGSSYCHSVFIKAGTVGNIMFRDEYGAGRHIVVNPTTGAIVSTSGALLGFGVVPVGNGWFRIWFSYTTDSTTARGLIRPDGGGTDQTFHCFGFQSEPGAFPTSYIRTTTTAVTRAADVATMTGANFSDWYRQDEGTLFAEFSYAAAVAAQSFVVQSTGDTGNYVAMYRDVSTQRMTAQVRSGAADPVFLFATASAVVANTAYKQALAYKTNDFASTVNKATPVTDTSGSPPSGMTRLGIGGATYTTSVQINGHIRRIAYYPQRLNNQSLQILTK